VRNYKNETAYTAIRKRLSRYLPSSMVNNILCVIDYPPECSKQWMFKLRKD